MYGDRYITDITFTGFERVHNIESGFMLTCPQLKTADLSSFEHLTTIKDCFMSGTKSLTEVKLPTTRFFKADLKTVGKHFLRGASSLAQIQEEALEGVTSIAPYFMASSGVESFDTEKLKDLRDLEEGFLADCKKLTRVNMGGLKRITPALVTKADVEAAWATYEATIEAVWTTYRQAWAHTDEAVDTAIEAAHAEKGALKIATTAIHQLKTTRSKEHAETIRENAKAAVLDAKAKKARAQQADAAADHTIETATVATDAAKAAKLKAQRLAEALRLGQRHNLGVLHGSESLDKNLNGIRGVEKLPRALRVELADRFDHPYFVEIEDECGCF